MRGVQGARPLVAARVDVGKKFSISFSFSSLRAWLLRLAARSAPCDFFGALGNYAVAIQKSLKFRQ